MENVEISENSKGESIMPTVEVIERERVAYIKGMEDYLMKLKKMKKSEAKKMSHENLVKSEIITRNGEFTEQYKFSVKAMK